MTSDGGAVAAFGFRFQYLVTVEEFLRAVTEDSGVLDALVLIVEPTRHDIGVGNDDDVIDFAIERDGRVEQHVQVKSSVLPSKSNTLRYADVDKIFARMGSEGEEAAVLTNKPLAPKLVRGLRRSVEVGGGQTGLPCHGLRTHSGRAVAAQDDHAG